MPAHANRASAKALLAQALRISRHRSATSVRVNLWIRMNISNLLVRTIMCAIYRVLRIGITKDGYITAGLVKVNKTVMDRLVSR